VKLNFGHGSVELRNFGCLVFGGDEPYRFRLTARFETGLPLGLEIEGVVDPVDSFEVTLPINWFGQNQRGSLRRNSVYLTARLAF
jgi:hypothetical protein